VNPSDADRNSEPPFSHRLLAALTDSGPWNTQTDIAVEAWIQLAGASAAILISPTGPDQLELICFRATSETRMSPTRLSLDAPFSVLLNQNALIEIVAESGMVGGLHMQVFPWTDLTAAIIVQWPEHPLTAEAQTFSETLISVSRQLLSKATDRPIVVPDPVTLNAMAEFSAGAGHEINNPLASIIGQTQLLLKNEQSPDRRQAFETIGAQAWRIRDMIGNSMLFARPPEPRRNRFNLVEISQQTLQPLTALANDHRIEIRLASTSDEIEMEADQSQLSTLITQFVRNSIEAIRSVDRPGTISVTLRDDQPGTVELSFLDDGPGLFSEEVRRHLFDPFYSGRSAGRGLGFGLCLAWQIAQMHGGLVLHESPAAGGTAFHVAIPTLAPA